MTESQRRRRRDATGAPTLVDVARAAGVSTATVSRALNTPEMVGEGTRARVDSAVRDLGYAPNFGAQALAAMRTNTFGAIVPTMENAIFARGLQAFEEELRRAGVTMLATSSAYDPEIEQEQIRTMIARGADAMLLIGHDRTDASYALLEARSIPYVVTWADDPSSHRPSVGFDNFVAMKELAEVVLELGHRSIGMITAQRADNDRARNRFLGIRAAIADGGIDPNSLAVVETSYSIMNGAQAFEELMGGPNPPTVIMCGNDVLAAGALKRAREMGVSVPEDVSITGFDGIELADIVSPPLTTVHVPHREMGRRAAELLIALRNREPIAPRIRLPAKIKRRGSLGPPRR